MFASINFGS